MNIIYDDIIKKQGQYVQIGQKESFIHHFILLKIKMSALIKNFIFK